MGKIYLTRKELATVAGYTYRRLHDIDMSLPDDGKLFVQGTDGEKCDLALFVQRWVKYKLENKTEGEKSLDAAKTEHEIIKTRKTELEVRRLEGSLVDFQQVEAAWAQIATNVTKNMLRIPNTVAPRIVMMGSVDIIKAIIEDEIRRVLNNIANTPLPENDDAESGTEDAERDE